MYELTIKQKLTNYYYFLLINTGIATIISCRYLLACNNFQLDASTIFFWFSSHISYMLLMSLFIGIIGSLGFIFKSNNKQQLFQAITVALALILLFVDTEVYLRMHVHLDIHHIIMGFIRAAFYLEFKLWLLFSIISASVLGYAELLLFKWIAKQTWSSNKKPLINTMGIIIVSIALTNSIFYIAVPNNKQYLIDTMSAYIPKFPINSSVDTNKKNIIQTSIDSIKSAYKLAKVLSLTTAEERFNKIYKTHYWTSDGVHRSGSGVALNNNLNLRNKLIEIVKEYNIKSILDGACGDFYWMNIVLPKLNLDKYIGGDIASYIITQNKQQYNYNNVEFMQMDITKDKLPNADLMMVRDTLGLLSYADIKLFFANFNRSNIKYLLVSTHNKEQKYFNNKDVITGEYRYIDLFDEPFNFEKTKVKLTIVDFNRNKGEMIFLSKEDIPKTF